jgi:FkbM family methyltransferase
VRKLVIRLHEKLFIRRRFFRFNLLLFTLGIKGMGVLNWTGNAQHLSGEAHFLRAFARLYRNRRPTVLDVGANLGEYAAGIRDLLPDSQVFAFEPHPLTFGKLRPTAESKGFTPVNVGCGEAPGQLELFDPAGEGPTHQLASLYKDVLTQLHRVTDVTSHRVDIVTLDDFLAARNLDRVHLLKVDTEGHELKVLHGFRRSLAAGLVDVVHLEFNEMNAVSRVFFKDFVDLLPNYDLFRLLPDGAIRMTRYTPLYWELFAYQNIVAVRKDLAAGFERSINGE